MTGETEHMREYAFGEFTRARVWIGALPDAKSTATQTLELIRWPSSQVLDNQVALEAWRGQGGRAEYGMLGGTWTSGAVEARLLVDASEPLGDIWLAGLSTLSGDPAHVGLPNEYAPAVLRALQGANVNFGPGTFHVTHAAHSQLGSNEALFAQTARGLAKLCLLREHGPEVLAILDEAFNKPAPPNPIHALQLACRQGASLLELIDLVHQECGASPYQRSLVTWWFFKTFEIGVRDVQELAAWEGFGDGATASLESVEAKLQVSQLNPR